MTTDDSAAKYAKTKPLWSLRVFESLPLPVRMRAAAEVLREANRMVPADENNEWQPSVLEHDAEVWEREAEKARAQRDQDRDVWIAVDRKYPDLMRLYYTETHARDHLTRQDILYKARLVDWEELT